MFGTDRLGVRVVPNRLRARACDGNYPAICSGAGTAGARLSPPHSCFSSRFPVRCRITHFRSHRIIFFFHFDFDL
ncbi:hypothetical protein OH687_33155 [Burkholderia anthina]|nr:hypothetical protein OH687_33155 [Burkholderia anthina]